MSENTVAIRCKSEMNRWMDSVMVVPQEQADDIEQNIKERMPLRSKPRIRSLMFRSLTLSRTSKSGCVASSATAPAMET